MSFPPFGGFNQSYILALVMNAIRGITWSNCNAIDYFSCYLMQMLFPLITSHFIVLNLSRDQTIYSSLSVVLFIIGTCSIDPS